MAIVQVRHNGPDFSAVPYPIVPEPSKALLKCLRSVENTDLAVYPAGFAADITPEVWKLARPSLKYLLEVDETGEAANLTVAEDCSQIPPEALRNARNIPDSPLAVTDGTIHIADSYPGHAYVGVPNANFMVVGGLVMHAVPHLFEYLQTQFPTTHIQQ